MAKAKPLNPWFTIWTQPRATMQQLLKRGRTFEYWLILCLAGIGMFLDQATSKDLGDVMAYEHILIASVIVGPILIVALTPLQSLIVWMTGSWIQGKGSFADVMASFVWTYITDVWRLGLFWVPQLIFIRSDMFTTEVPIIEANPYLAIALLISVFFELIVIFWGFIVFLKCLAEVQGFSAWKALLNLILASVIAIIIVCALAIIIIVPILIATS